MSAEAPYFYEFGCFRLDPLKRQLICNGEPLPLTSKALDTLLILVQESGKTVEKELLMRRVWGGAIVEENNLTQAIYTLRKVLGKDPSQGQYIITVPRQGYRFVGSVKRLSPPASEDRDGSAPPVTATASARAESTLGSSPSEGLGKRLAAPSRFKVAGMAVIGAVVVLISLIVAMRQTHRAEPLLKRHSEKAGPAAPRQMIAVLPFDNLTGDASQEYLSEGFTEEIITQLGRLNPSHVGIIAWTSVARYENGKAETHQIAAELGVDYILEGSMRRSKGRVRISTQLVRASDRTEVWASDFERPRRDILALQADVAREAQKAISETLGLTPFTLAAGRSPANPEAYDAYLRGLYFMNRRDAAGLQSGIANFTRAIQEEPSYANAYAGVADCYLLLAMEGWDPERDVALARAAAQKSIALDDSLPGGHTALGVADVLAEWNWRDAGREFERALSIDPNDELAHQWYAMFYLAPLGRSADAISEMKRAQRLDPVSPIVNTDLGWSYLIAGRVADALSQYKKTLLLDPNFVPLHYRLAEYYLDGKMYDDWIKEVSEDLTLDGRPNEAALYQRLYHAQGFQGALLADSETAQQAGKPMDALLWRAARDNALMKRNSLAIKFLAELCDRRSPGLIYLKVDPVYSSLRFDPRFQALERRMGVVN
ncbi:MAG: winged helix-turn-helix domain-containing tetratricopeptide repeat protein [Terriglobia bacterium]